MGFSKHEFACIPIAAVHSNTGSVYEYKLPWNTSSFCMYKLFIFHHESSKKTNTRNCWRQWLRHYYGACYV